MKQAFLKLLALVGLSMGTLAAQPHDYFNNCQVEGSTVIFNSTTSQWYFTDSVDVMRPTLPSSTFKIINLAIALELDVIENETVVFTYKGSHNSELYGDRPDVCQDLTVEEAYRKSAIWVFLEIAEQVGEQRYLEILNSCDYGNQHLKGEGLDFWNFGSFAISPYDQVKYLKDLFNYRLFFSKRTVDIVKKVMLDEEQNGYKIYGKTGWSRDDGMNTGWWVGLIEKGADTWFFATRIERPRIQSSRGFSQCRKEITWKVFEELGVNLK